jgi:hypothetical protein
MNTNDEMAQVQALKDRREYSLRNYRRIVGRVPFQDLVRETHKMNSSGCVVCPKCGAPKLYVGSSYGRCEACNWHVDHPQWLMVTQGLTLTQAFDELEARAGVGNAPRF